MIADIRGIQVAFLNYTDLVAKALPTEENKDFAVNTLTLEAVSEDALTARTWGADVVVALLNYGTESGDSPSAEQKSLSENILGHGVDAILGCEARVVQPIGHIFTYASWRANDKYVAYSLGDFLSTPRVGSVEGAAAEEATAEGESSTETTAPAKSITVPSSGLIAYLHLQQRGLRTFVTGVSYLPVYVQVSAATKEQPARYRVLPVLPGLEPATDIPLTSADRQRMAQIWEQARTLIYRPDENISPLLPAALGL